VPEAVVRHLAGRCYELRFDQVDVDAAHAYLCDVYVLEAHRRQGLADWMIQSLQQHPDLQGLRRQLLFTRDMHPLYRRHGYEPLAAPERGMEIVRPGLYLAAQP
jgi:GNAT superfamily N-acetyltransferase